jgi:hypothetical protein
MSFQRFFLAASACLSTLLLLNEPRAFADTITLDDFSTAVQFNSGQFSSSSIWNAFQSTQSTVRIGSGVTATWFDNGSGILGGRRNVVAQNAANSTQASRVGIKDTLFVDSPASNFMCLTCLFYSFSPINVDLYHRFYIDFVGLDATAVGKITGTLTIKDSANRTSVATLATTSAFVGRNFYELSEATNWNNINRSDIVYAEMSFTTSTNAVDFRIDAMGFSTNPEPSTFVVMAVAFAAGAGIHWRRKNIRKDRSSNDTPKP